MSIASGESVGRRRYSRMAGPVKVPPSRGGQAHGALFAEAEPAVVVRFAVNSARRR